MRLQRRIDEKLYFYEAVDYLSKISRLSAAGRSHPLTVASRANIGVESARVRNVTERQHTTAAYVCADTIPGVVDTWERGHASSSPLCACPDAPQLRGLFLPSRLSRIFATQLQSCKLLAGGCGHEQL